MAETNGTVFLNKRQTQNKILKNLELNFIIIYHNYYKLLKNVVSVGLLVKVLISFW